MANDRWRDQDSNRRSRDYDRDPDLGRGDYGRVRYGGDYGQDRYGGDYGQGRYGGDYGPYRDYSDRGYGDRDYGGGTGRFGQYGRPAYGGDYSRYSDRLGGYASDYGPDDFGYGGGGYRGSDYGRGQYGRGNYGGYGRQGWGGAYDRDYRGGSDRNWMERAGDEVSSWFGDDDAERRRQMDRERGGHYGRGPKGYTRSDERIREDVNDRLTDNWQLDASNIDITVKDGEVTLNGTVDSRQDKRRAEDLADDCSGVKHVQNNLRVQQASGSQQTTAAGSTRASS